VRAVPSSHERLHGHQGARTIRLTCTLRTEAGDASSSAASCRM
jgi:hypothetical protein